MSLLTVAVGCELAYIPTIAPKDAAFTLSCAPTCGRQGREGGVLVDVSFVGHGRQFAICCDDVPALRARLATIERFWCDGLDVPTKQIGDLSVGVTVSEGTGKRGASIDQGDGYVAFNCDDWLPKLIAQLGTNGCCGGTKAVTPETR